MYDVKFLRGLQNNYDNIVTKDNKTFYYTTDSKNLYIGDIKLSNAADLNAAITRIAANEAAIAVLNGNNTTAGSVAKQIKDAVDALQGDTTTSLETIEDEIGTLSSLTTTTKTDLVSAINEVDAHADAAQTDVDNLETYVGTIPGTASSTNIVDYVTEVANGISSSLGGAFHFQGTVADMTALNAISNPAVGDVYQVTTTSTGTNGEFAYNGSAWVELGTTVDLSSYSTTSQVNTLIANYTDAALSWGSF